MPVPKNAVTVTSIQIPLPAELSGLTELRVHGVGGTPPDALLNDLAPEQTAGDRIAGFYRTSDHKAVTDLDIDRHVEGYSWGGLTSRSRSRVLWLMLLPFMLGNLAGWMCSAKTRRSPGRFALHRAAAGLGALALTVNVALVAVMITADVLAYQAVRAGLAGHQWWLAPLRWPQVKDHPSRQVLLGVLAVAILMLTLYSLARQARQRYEAVPPPFKDGEDTPASPIAAAALDSPRGLANKDFWNGDLSVRLLVRLHLGVAIGFLAIALGITVRALATEGEGSPQWMALWWLAICTGGAAVALAVVYLCTDAIWAQQLDNRLRDALAWLVPAVAAVALATAGVFAWFQPGRKSALETAASLPGLASVIEWTALGLAVPVAVLGLSVLLGAGDQGKRLFGGPWVTLVLGYSVLNVVMLGGLIWLARIVGPVTTDATAAVHSPHPGIYIPHLITVGVPVVALSAVAAGIVFGLAEVLRRQLAPPVPTNAINDYRRQAEQYMAGLPRALELWYQSAQPDKTWESEMARARWLGQAPYGAPWLMWGIVLLQLAAAICIWQFPWEPPLYLRNVGTVVAAGLLTPLMAYLYSGWSKPDRRRHIAVLWDVGTFWPRSYHPLSPPCYTERAIPDLQRRMWWLHDNKGRVVLAAHSQGAMLAVAATVQEARGPDNRHVALATFGSPVCKLYGWAFPAYVDTDLLARLASDAEPVLVDYWRNFYYPTDPIAGPVTPGPAPQEARQVNRPLSDPAECWYVYGQPLPKAKGHSGYWADPRVWSEINCLARNLSAIRGAVCWPQSASAGGQSRGSRPRGRRGVKGG